MIICHKASRSLTTQSITILFSQSSAIREYVESSEDSDEADTDLGATGVEANIIYSMKSGIFKPLLTGAVVVMLMVIVIGLTWEFTRRKKNKVLSIFCNPKKVGTLRTVIVEKIWGWRKVDVDLLPGISIYN